MTLGQKRHRDVPAPSSSVLLFYFLIFFFGVNLGRETGGTIPPVTIMTLQAGQMGAGVPRVARQMKIASHYCPSRWCLSKATQSCRRPNAGKIPCLNAHENAAHITGFSIPLAPPMGPARRHPARLPRPVLVRPQLRHGPRRCTTLLDGQNPACARPSHCGPAAHRRRRRRAS